MAIIISDKNTFLSHSLADAISWQVWNGALFQHRITKIELDRMNGTLADAASQLDEDDNPEKSLVCLILGHPETPVVEMLDVIRSMTTIAPDAIINACVLTGNRALLEGYVSSLDPEQRKAVIRYCGITAYRRSACYGHLDVLQYLETLMTEEHIQQAIAYQDFAAVKDNAANGFLDVLQHLESMMTNDQKREVFDSGRYSESALTSSVLRGQLNIVRHLIEDGCMDHDMVSRHIAKGNCRIYSDAAGGGSVELMVFLQSLMTEEQLQTALTRNRYKSYTRAAQQGHLDVLQHLESLMTTEQVQQAIDAKACRAWSYAAINGHFEVLQHLERQMTPEQLQKALTNESRHVYRRVVKKGDLEMLKHVVSHMTKEQLQDENNACTDPGLENYFDNAYELAVTEGHLEILKYLESLMTAEQKQTALKAINYHIFTLAAEAGHIEVLKHLQEGIANDHDRKEAHKAILSACRQALRYGHVELIPYIETHIEREMIEEALKADNHEIYYYAAIYGHTRVMQHLDNHYHANMTEALGNDIFDVYCEAAGGSHIATLVYLENHMSSERRESVIAHLCRDVGVLWEVRHNLSLLTYLLRKPLFLEWAILHQDELGPYLKYEIEKMFREYRLQAARFAEVNPMGTFNLDENDARIACGLAFSLIQDNTPESTECLQFLMSIPNVAMRAHEPVRGESNPLLRRALRFDNQGAAAILLSLPQVHQMAQNNNFYVHEQQGDLDLRELAANIESSMIALSKEERRRLKKVRRHYLGDVAKENMPAKINAVFETLQTTLSERYKADPAFIMREQVRIDLPLTWQEFKDLKLQGEEERAALRAYYQHTVHTAFRWVLKPNPWMSPYAGFVKGNPEEGQGYAELGRHIGMIASLWLAVSDENTEATDGYTIEGRIEHFITELASINRAHNWDHQRFVINSDGSFVINSDGTRRIEEYDDKEGDKPGCAPGNNRRLFHAIVGHPMLQSFGEVVFDEELRSFAREHFQNNITRENLPLLEEVESAFNEGEPLTEPQKKALDELNIPPVRIEEFSTIMRGKYKSQWGATWQARLEARLALTTPDANHVNSLWLLTNFSQLLQAMKRLFETDLVQKQTIEPDLFEEQSREEQGEQLWGELSAEFFNFPAYYSEILAHEYASAVAAEVTTADDAHRSGKRCTRSEEEDWSEDRSQARARTASSIESTGETEEDHEFWKDILSLAGLPETAPGNKRTQREELEQEPPRDTVVRSRVGFFNTGTSQADEAGNRSETRRNFRQ